MAKLNSTILIGDVRQQLQYLPDNSVHCAVTSPPYFGLRDYATATWSGGDPNCEHVGAESNQHGKEEQAIHGRNDIEAGEQTVHRWRERNPNLDVTPMKERYAKAKDVANGAACIKCGAIKTDLQIGLEQTPEEYVNEMVNVCREVRRVLREDGTFWLNIGDSYAVSGGAHKHGWSDDGEEIAHRNKARGTYKSKDLIGIPWMVALALRNDGWYWRSTISWCKTVPLPESIQDRPTSTWEPIFMFSKSPKYFYDNEAVREGSRSPEVLQKHGIGQKLAWERAKVHGREPVGNEKEPKNVITDGTRNMRNVWNLGPEPAPEFHFATFPLEIPRRCLSAGVSKAGACSKCGTPWVRILERSAATTMKVKNRVAYGRRYQQTDDPQVVEIGITNKTLGWEANCDCEDAIAIPPLVLDPFFGAGTTAIAAALLGCDSIGIELNPEFAKAAKVRINNQVGLYAHADVIE